MTVSTILQLALEFVIIFPAIVLHEVSHGYVAYLLGDPTAKLRGRLTLNPIAHVDPVGTVILPLILLFGSGGRFFFGWAKPVPFDPRNFKDERMGMLLTGIAGPVTNILLAVVAGLLSRAFPLSPNFTFGQFQSIGDVLLFFAYANLVLAFFNLIPIPPLDGSRVVQRFLPDTLRNAYHSLERYGFLIIIALSWIAPGLLAGYLSVTVLPVLGFITGK